MAVVYPDSFEQKLNFIKVRELLAGLCLSPMGIENVEGMTFSSNFDDVRCWLEQAEEVTRCEEDGTQLPVSSYFDLRAPLKKIRVDGLFLEEGELFDLLKSLRAIKDVLRFINSKNSEEYPRLRELAATVKFYPMVMDRVDSILNNHGKIKDNASPELGRLRNEIARQQQSVTKRMAAILRQAQAAGLSEPDAGISIRDGRAVIPVISANKRKLKGIVHDESATGKTTYIEPAEIVETNNEIRELSYAERREVTRILTEVSAFMRPYLPELLEAYLFLGKIDFIRAKTRFARLINGTIPEIRDEQSFHWIEARHPLLYLQNKPQNRPVIPMSLELTSDKRVVLISGPNAGGKSVCLQTVGLVQYMIQCGLPVPVKEGSFMGLFEKIFLDMGDEQSIENDLSTYSSHLLNMKNFVKGCNNRSLVLIDEFGTGTEPMLGGAIAEAVLEHLLQRGIYGIVTTHYTNLKHFASQTPGIVNGAMQFDTHQLQPLFILEVGVPGSSFAFEIARKIGLPEPILEKAKAQLGDGHVNFDKHLREIIRDKRYLEQKRRSIKEKEQKLETITGRFEKELGQFTRERGDLIRQAKAEAANILANANKAIENTISEIKQSQADKERTRLARQELASAKANIISDAQDEATPGKYALVADKLQRRKDAKGKIEPDTREASKTAGKRDSDLGLISEGDMVKLEGQPLPGEVLEVKGKEALVAFGQLVTKLKVSRLEKISKGALKREMRQESTTVSNLAERIREKKLSFTPGIDLRGMRATEAIEKVISHLDEAVMCGVGQVRILHGKGDGVLRRLIREQLRTIPFVKTFADEDIQLGGAGITIVELD